MNRRQRLRAQALDRLHHSHLGGYGWVVDTVEWLGRLFVGHRGFDEMPDLCRHCGEDFDLRTGSRR